MLRSKKPLKKDVWVLSHFLISIWWSWWWRFVCRKQWKNHQNNSYSPHNISFFDSFQYLQHFYVGRRFSDLHQTLYFRRWDQKASDLMKNSRTVSLTITEKVFKTFLHQPTRKWYKRSWKKNWAMEMKDLPPSSQNSFCCSFSSNVHIPMLTNS